MYAREPFENVSKHTYYHIKKVNILNARPIDKDHIGWIEMKWNEMQLLFCERSSLALSVWIDRCGRSFVMWLMQIVSGGRTPAFRERPREREAERANSQPLCIIYTENINKHLMALHLFHREQPFHLIINYFIYIWRFILITIPHCRCRYVHISYTYIWCLFIVKLIFYQRFPYFRFGPEMCLGRRCTVCERAHYTH